MTTSIKISSRASVKVGDSFYTLEYTEERSINPDATEEEILKERKNLWDTCNNEVDMQIEDIMKLYKK